MRRNHHARSSKRVLLRKRIHLNTEFGDYDNDTTVDDVDTQAPVYIVGLRVH